MLFIQGVHVCTACKNSSFCTVLHGLPMPAPAHLVGSPNPLVSRAPQTQKKEMSRLREFAPSLRNVSTPFFYFFFARSGNSNLSVIKVFLRQKGSDQGSLDAGRPERASKNSFFKG